MTNATQQTELFESIQIMTRFTKEIENNCSLIVNFNLHQLENDNTDPLKSTLLNSLFSMSIINSLSFLDEYNQEFGVRNENRFNNRIKDVKIINEPFIKKINEWSDLSKLRNQFLAHNLRIGKHGKYIFTQEEITYNAPRTVNDLFLLCNLIGLSTQTIHLEFHAEFKNYRKTQKISNITPSMSLSKEDVSKITSNLIREARANLKNLNKAYDYSLNCAIV